ncbi:flagellar biosynthetic protein FliR [Frigidibacter oleivorans]|uniref:flagellar biosynthetic protein FliR n=1 Tax=Frigidibacter oleivorans TaxID=2487129 RepID=UPI000F8EFB12|nr:flagellar biosynthetic protein FliR [Frigidibacter oleivorans]
MEAVVTLPAIDLAPLLAEAQGIVVALPRIGAFLMAAPAFGARFVPLPVRIVAGVVLALPVMGNPALPPVATMATLAALPLILGEVAFGLTAGLVMQILFAAAAMAGDRIANAAGLGFAAQLDPAGGGQNPVIAQVFGMAQLMVLFASDGHLTVLRLILDSFWTLPPGTVPPLAELARAGIGAGSAMFALAVTLMLPAVAGLILLNLAVGVLTRSAPQLNLFSVGFPLTLLGGVLLLWLTAPETGRGMAGVVAAAAAQVAGLAGAGAGE